MYVFYFLVLYIFNKLYKSSSQHIHINIYIYIYMYIYTDVCTESHGDTQHNNLYSIKHSQNTDFHVRAYSLAFFENPSVEQLDVPKIVSVFYDSI